jgi:release factor glutamine methyltransferase
VSVHEAIAAARRTLVEAGIPADDAALDAEVLARHALGWDRAALIIRGRENPPPGFAGQFAALIARRTGREPVAYITGVREFWGRDFEVSRDVLIPRPETELIVEEALEAAQGRRPATIVDVGTGSGCLAVTLAQEVPGAHIVATDVSPAALLVARRNANRYRVDDRIVFTLTNLLDGIAGPIDLIVANPPYMAPDVEPTLQPEVARFEPRQALYGGRDGLDAYRGLFPAAADRLADAGRLVVEFGLGQEADVRRLASTTGLTVVRVRPDLQGIPRVAVLRQGGSRARLPVLQDHHGADPRNDPLQGRAPGRPEGHQPPGPDARARRPAEARRHAQRPHRAR